MENFSQLLKEYEDVINEEYLKTEKRRKILIQQQLNHILEYKKGKRILDIGCIAGYFLELAKEKMGCIWN